MLFESLEAPGAYLLEIYKSYLWMRSASYMQIEAGSDGLTAQPAPKGVT